MKSTNSEVEIVQVQSKADKEQFVRLPMDLHGQKGKWIHPLLFDSLERIDPKKNPFFEFGEAAFWLARKNGEAVGRISAQVNNRYLDRYQDATGQFGYLDAIDDPEVFSALLKTAETWLKAKGLKRVCGPFQLSINEESGMLIDGFDEPPALLMGHAEPYYLHQVEGQGYHKAKDLHAFKVDVQEGRNPRIDRMLRANKDSDVTIRQINLKKIDQEIDIVFQIFEDAWSENWGYVPFSKGELKHMAASMKMILKPELALIAEADGEPCGILICLPNVNEAIADLNGKLLPFGWAKLLWRLKVKGLKSGRVVLAGVRKKHHGTMVGMSAFGGMLSQLNDNAARLGMDYGELSWVLEDNKPVQRLLHMGGYPPYKTYRIFEKKLAE